MNRIAFVVPYFGQFRNYYKFWMRSCYYNPSIDWLVFTDCKVELPPPNVKIILTTLQELRKRIKALYDFPITLDKPYKLCDYKPAYGEIFEQELKGYDFWGYCDEDLIWGNIRNFITEEILDKYDKIGSYGHCCLLRNNERMRTLYRYESKTIVTYREAFCSSLSYGFDETHCFSQYCKENGISVFEDKNFFDVSCRYEDFRSSSCGLRLFEGRSHNIIKFDKGNLKMYSVDCKTKEMKSQDILYAHLQKRHMRLETDNYDSYIIYPNVFADQIGDITVKDVIKFDPKRLLRFIYYRIVWGKIKAKYLRSGGVIYYKPKKLQD